jgi:hypothetical protein
MKDSIIEDISVSMDRQMDQLMDIIEILEASKTIRHPMWPEEMKALKEAFEAHDANDWDKCRSALLVYLEYVYEDILIFDISKWNLKHIFRWQNMLEATDLGNESECELYHKFLLMVQDQILNLIPPKFRLSYKGLLKKLSPGFIDMLNNFTNDRKHSEIWMEIGGFLETAKEPDSQNTPT